MKSFIERYNDVDYPALTKSPVTRVQLTQYAGASGDFNPIHIDEEFAKKSPLGGVIAHGMLSMGFLGQYVEQLAEDGEEVHTFKVQFRGIVRPGDTITCEAELKEVADERAVFSVQAKNQHGDGVVIGEATLLKRK